MKERKMAVKKIVLQKIWCEPEQQFPLETKHQFEATKVYLMSDSEGREDGIVICPTHQLPYSVTIVRRRLQSGDGKPPSM
jgi:hypothetical protein